MLASLIIVFREIIEAGLIVGIVLAATKGVPRRGWWVGWGVIGGAAGALLVAAFAGQLASLFAGSGQELFNAAILALAVAMLTWHNAWMASHGRALSREMRAIGADVAAGRRPLAALAIVCGVAVLREGSEIVLFLYGIAASGGTSTLAMLAGGALGLARRRVRLGALVFGIAFDPGEPAFCRDLGPHHASGRRARGAGGRLRAAGGRRRNPDRAGVGHVVALERRQPGGAAPAHARRLHGPAFGRAARGLLRDDPRHRRADAQGRRAQTRRRARREGVAADPYFDRFQSLTALMPTARWSGVMSSDLTI